MTNEALDVFLTKYKEAMCAISLNDNRCIYIGYDDTSSHLYTDIKTEKIGGVDFFSVKAKCCTQTPTVYYTVYHPTLAIQSIYVMDPGCEDLRIDPMILK